MWNQMQQTLGLGTLIPDKMRLTSIHDRSFVLNKNEIQNNGSTVCLVGATKMKDGIDLGYHIHNQGSFIVHREFIPGGQSLTEGTLLALTRAMTDMRVAQHALIAVKDESKLRVLGRREEGVRPQ